MPNAVVDTNQLPPGALEPGGTATLAEARACCRRLARTHYENFSVASVLLPRRLRQHFYHVYAYCRHADDLADECPDKDQSLGLLDAWEQDLLQCTAGKARHPILIALAETIREFEIPLQPLRDLLIAFRQDQRVDRYETFSDLLAYCANSANPVGRLVLYLGRCHDEPRGELSDRICTGLQLANFCQDVARDWDRGRVYLPQETLRSHGCGEEDFKSRQATPAFRQALAHEVRRAEEWLTSGLPLVEKMEGRLRGDVWLFAQGGLKILSRIRALDHDVWTQRPTVTRWDQLKLLGGAAWRGMWGSSRGAD